MICENRIEPQSPQNTQRKIWMMVVCGISFRDESEMLNSWNYPYKPLLQNRLFAFYWPFGRENAPILAFSKPADNETVMKTHCFP